MADDEGQEQDQDVFAKRTEITAGFTHTEVDTALLYRLYTEFPPPFELNVLDDRFPSQRYLPLEVRSNAGKGKSVMRILVLTGSDPDEDLQTIVKLTLEPYKYVMSARGGTEKQMVQGFHRYVRGLAAEEWHLVLDEANLNSLENDAGEYPKGTYNDMTVKWLARMCQNQALRDSYISWLEATAKKGVNVSANLYSVLFKVGMRIMTRTGSTKKWPSVTEFIV